MKKTAIAIATTAALSFASGSTYAALASNAVLDFAAAPTGGIVEPASGSWFSMLALDLDLDGVSETNVYTPTSSFEGIRIGEIQTASGSHTGSPDGTENPTIDNPWVFFTNTGMHGTVDTPITILTDDGAGNVTLDFSGWFVDWNGGQIDMGAGAPAVMTCSGDCSAGDTYTLDYSAVVPSGQFTGVPYAIHLEGTVVPVPAAVWLFGTGLLALVGVARRRKSA